MENIKCKIFWMQKIKCKTSQQNFLDGKDKVQNLSAKSFEWESTKSFVWKR